MQPITWVALLVSLLAPQRSGSERPSGLEGAWSGRWVREGSSLEVVLRFERAAGGFHGSFDSEALRVVGVPLESVRCEAARASWRLVGDESVMEFEGTLEGDRLVGRFHEGAASGRFELARAELGGPLVREEELTFSSGELLLAGTLVLPAGDGPHPGVVFLHGSGPEGRWASHSLARGFARRGIAGLIYDKRGVGRSQGDWRTSGFEELAQDGAAAVAELRARPEVDAARVGLYGHSQGGTIAPFVASRVESPAFVVASAAGGVPLDEMEAFSVENALGVPSLSKDAAIRARAFVEAIVSTAFRGEPHEAVLEAYAWVRAEPWAFVPPPPDDPYWSFSRRIAGFDPLAAWRRLGAPALLVYGSRDERVPVRLSAERIASAYLAGTGVELSVRVFPDADHGFRLPARDPERFEWPVTVSGYPEAVIDWVRRVTGIE